MAAVMAAPGGGELRVLCLHGYGQNAERFRARTGALRKALRGRARLLYLDAPLRLPAAGGGAPGDGAGPRGWWAEGAEGPGEAGAEEAVGRALAELGPVDGLLGFSQGAALAGLLCARCGGERGFRFALLVSGFPAGRAAAEAGAGSLRVPSLHVFGRADRVIPPEESRALASRFHRPVLLEHPGGHFVPAAAAQRAAYLAFLRPFQEGAPPRPPPPPDSHPAASLRGAGRCPEGEADRPDPSRAAAAAGGGGGGEPRAGDLRDARPGSPQSGLQQLSPPGARGAATDIWGRKNPAGVSPGAFVSLLERGPR